MGVGEIAGLIAAIAFAILAGFMIYPLIRLGKLFDQIAKTVKDTGDHAIPALDESVTTVQQVNKSLEDVNKISAAASTTANNVGGADRSVWIVPRQAGHQGRFCGICPENHCAVLREQEEHQQCSKQQGGVMFKRLFWISIGVGIGAVAVTKAQAYVKANTPDAARQFLFGPDQDHVAVRTLEALFNEFDEARRAREAELNTKYASKIS